MSRLIDQLAFITSWNRKSFWFIKCDKHVLLSEVHLLAIIVIKNKGEKANCTYIFNYSLGTYWSIGRIVKMFLYTCNYVNLRLKIYYLRKSFRREINCNMNLD